MKDRFRTPSFRHPSKPRGLVPPQALDTEAAEKAIAEYRRSQPTSTRASIEALLTPRTNYATPEVRATKVAVFYGESGEVPLDDLVPSRRIGHVALGEFIIDLRALTEVDPTGFVDPAVLDASVKAAVTKTLIMPSTCTVPNDGQDFLNGWRASLRKHLAELACDDDSLDSIWRAFSTDKTTGKIDIGTCPRLGYECSPPLGATKADNILIAPAGGTCPRCNNPVFAADGFRLHRELQAESPNADVFARLRQALLHLIQWHYVAAVAKDKHAALADCAFLMIGPHAMFGPTAAGLRYKFLQHYDAIYATADPIPLMIGLYVNGPFHDHARRLEIEPGQVMELTYDYIVKHIAVGQTDWGKDTYYGQPFIYRTKSGYGCAFTLPRRPGAGSAPANYPEMSRALDVLDRIIDAEDTSETTVPVMVRSQGAVDRAAAQPLLQHLTKP